MLKSQLAAGATVSESKLLADRQTGAAREVDIVVETTVAGHPVILSVECRDHRRIADVGWVEQMIGKHQRLPSHALILASRSGFSAEARRVAENAGVQLLALDEMTAGGVASLLAETSSLWFKIFDLLPTKVVAITEALDGIPSERVVLEIDTSVFAAPGNLLGSAHSIVVSLLRDKNAVRLLARDGMSDHKYFTLSWPLPALADGVRLMLQRIEPLIFVPLAALEIQGQCQFRVCEFRLRRASMRGVDVVWGRSAFEERDAMLVGTLDQNGVPRLTVDVRERRNHDSDAG
ncbi:MAG: hypothetical protein IPF98_13695 [Gemmatimonadetes bacterium]|nr:hypothetical protein [Gemmatimonadota bacterium]